MRAGWGGSTGLLCAATPSDLDGMERHGFRGQGSRGLHRSAATFVGCGPGLWRSGPRRGSGSLGRGMRPSFIAAVLACLHVPHHSYHSWWAHGLGPMAGPAVHLIFGGMAARVESSESLCSVALCSVLAAVWQQLTKWHLESSHNSVLCSTCIGACKVTDRTHGARHGSVEQPGPSSEPLNPRRLVEGSTRHVAQLDLLQLRSSAPEGT